MEFWETFYNYFLLGMCGLAIIIFVILQFITPAYGMTFNNRWGMSVKSKMGWMIMESPVFISMLAIYIISLVFHIKPFNIVTLIIFIFFQAHYIQRSFIFPPLMRCKSKMPISIVSAGFLFNTCNAFMQGGWLFFFSPNDYYPVSWLYSPQFIIGTILFIGGMAINMHSDRVIRSLREDYSDSNYYIPKGGLFRYVNSANYFGEIVEWIGFALLSASFSGWVFVFWSMANMVPRAKAVYEKYTQFFGEEFTKLNRYKIFPWIY